MMILTGHWSCLATDGLINFGVIVNELDRKPTELSLEFDYKGIYCWFQLLIDFVVELVIDLVFELNSTTELIMKSTTKSMNNWNQQ